MSGTINTADGSTTIAAVIVPLAQEDDARGKGAAGAAASRRHRSRPATIGYCPLYTALIHVHAPILDLNWGHRSASSGTFASNAVCRDVHGEAGSGWRSRPMSNRWRWRRCLVHRLPSLAQRYTHSGTRSTPRSSPFDCYKTCIYNGTNDMCTPCNLRMLFQRFDNSPSSAMPFLVIISHSLPSPYKCITRKNN